MIQYSLRIVKRFAVLIPGLFIAYLSVRDIFPYFDRRLPLAVAVLLTYIIGAYLLIPAIIRVVRAIRPARHLPLYCVTPDGFASDPLNIGLLGTRRQLITSMEAIGWHMADPHSLRFMARYGFSLLFSTPYPNAPVSSLFLFGRMQDIAFEKESSGKLGHRHHVRFWATTFEDTGKLNFQRIHWHHRARHVQGDNLLWVGAASLDKGVNLIRHNLQLTHMIAPDTDAERKLIIGQLRAARLIRSVDTIKLGDPYRLVNRVWRGYLNTDGQMAIGTLKNN